MCSFVSIVSSQTNRATVNSIAVYRSSQLAVGHHRAENKAKSLFLNFLHRPTSGTPLIKQP